MGSLAASLIAGEMALRSLKMVPYTRASILGDQIPIEVDPPDSMFRPDPEPGFRS